MLYIYHNFLKFRQKKYLGESMKEKHKYSTSEVHLIRKIFKYLSTIIIDFM